MQSLMNSDTASRSKPSWGILGGRSAIGRELLKQDVGKRFAFAFARQPGSHLRLVENYAEIDAAMLEGLTTLVNCVGIATGPSELLEHVNVTTAVRAAHAAKLAGVRRFIQISSFSIFGHAASITHKTQINPSSAYGKSKARAEERLFALQDADFKVDCLRLPAIVGPGRAGKVRQLAQLCRATRMMPVPYVDVCRAMISEQMAARVLLNMPTLGGPGFAADPVPFSYALFSRAVASGVGGHLRVPIPKWAISVAKHIAPAAAVSMWTDNYLHPEHNLCVALGEKGDLEQTLTEVVAAT